MLSEGQKEKLDLVKVVRFLINSSTFSGVHVESFVDAPVAVEDSAWGRSEETVRSATNFALSNVLETDCEDALRSRNELPECMILLILIAKLGRKQVQFVTGAIMERLQCEKGKARNCLLLSLLRIYACLPFSMNLGAAALRSNLKEAVDICSNDWLSWRAPFDDPLQDMLLTALASNASPRSVQSLIDAAKKHPLLLLRKLDRMETALENDALAITSTGAGDRPGVIVGQGLDGPLQVKVKGKSMQVNLIHWGYNYTEHIWMVILDVISAVPSEVLFGCALKMGLTDLLDLYISLVFVQSQLRTSDRLSKLKGKLSDIFTVFKSVNINSWDVWLASKNRHLTSLGATRNILMCCGFISHEQAIQNVKKAHSEATNLI
jgi:hypothetical protein